MLYYYYCIWLGVCVCVLIFDSERLCVYGVVRVRVNGQWMSSEETGMKLDSFCFLTRDIFIDPFFRTPLPVFDASRVAAHLFFRPQTTHARPPDATPYHLRKRN